MKEMKRKDMALDLTYCQLKITNFQLVNYVKRASFTVYIHFMCLINVSAHDKESTGFIGCAFIILVVIRSIVRQLREDGTLISFNRVQSYRWRNKERKERKPVDDNDDNRSREIEREKKDKSFLIKTRIIQTQIPVTTSWFQWVRDFVSFDFRMQLKSQCRVRLTK